MNKNPLTDVKSPDVNIKHIMSLLGYDTAEELNERMENNYNRHLSLLMTAKEILSK